MAFILLFLAIALWYQSSTISGNSQRQFLQNWEQLKIEMVELNDEAEREERFEQFMRDTDFAHSQQGIDPTTLLRVAGVVFLLSILTAVLALIKVRPFPWNFFLFYLCFILAICYLIVRLISIAM